MTSKKAKLHEFKIHHRCLRGDRQKVVELINGKAVLNIKELDRYQTLLATLENDNDKIFRHAEYESARRD